VLKEQLMLKQFSVNAIQKSAEGIVGITLDTEGLNITGMDSV
jgi:hypothetical protein